MAVSRKAEKQTRRGRVSGPVAAASRLRKLLRVSAKTLAPVLVLALGIATFVGLKATKPEIPQRALQERVWPVKAVAADITNFQPALTLYGQTVSGRRVELRSLVSGEVLETGPRLREGGVVAKGDVLLRIDPFQYRGALDEAEAKLAEARAKSREISATIESEQDALKRAREQLEIARRDLERAVPLAEKGTVSKKVADDRRMIVSEREQSLDQRVNNLAIQQARAAQQRAVISQLEWRVRQAKRNLEDTVLTAPFDAYVTSVGAETGRIVSANDRVATLLDANWVDVRFTLSDRQYGRIVASGRPLAGRRVKVLWYVGDEPVSYSARIERVGAEIAAEKGGVEIYARLDDPNS
ncbi:MAG: HlyD family secretion protein, partial [Methyloligellaceae bacterium]